MIQSHLADVARAWRTGELVELTVIILGLLLAVGGLVALAGLVLHASTARGTGLVLLASRLLEGCPRGEGRSPDLRRRVRAQLQVSPGRVLAL